MNTESRKTQKMTEGGEILAKIMQRLLDKVRPGVDTLSLDLLAEELCRENNVIPAFKGYQDFPATICVGPNDVVVHGIPDDIALRRGDIVSVDMGIIYKGYYLDMARTVGVGEISPEKCEFIDITRRALEFACIAAVTGNTVGDIGHAIESTVTKHGYSVVREMVGHGVGKKLHEPPQIPGYGIPGEGDRLQAGQTIAIEAIINEGDPAIVISAKDGWTARTKDGKLSALFENTVLVSEEAVVLTPL